MHDGLKTEPASDIEDGTPDAYVIKQIVQNAGRDLR